MHVVISCISNENCNVPLGRLWLQGWLVELTHCNHNSIGIREMGDRDSLVTTPLCLTQR